MNDRDLAERLARDLDGAFELAVRAYQHRLYAFAYALTGSRRDAEEVAQDAFVRAYRAMAKYPRERIATLQLRAWLFQITVNVARNHQRRHRSADLPLDGGDDEDGRGAGSIADAATAEPESLAIVREGDRRVAALVARLPARYGEAVVLRHVHGLGYAEIAAIVGQPVGTVKSNVHRGVALLRAALVPGHEDEPGHAAPPAHEAQDSAARQSGGRLG